MRGITLLEIAVSIAIITIVATIMTNAFSSFRTQNDLLEAHSNIVGILKDARSRTLNSENNTTYGVHFEETKVVLFAGATYNSGSASNETYFLPNSIKISSIDLGGPVDAVFARLTGEIAAYGSAAIASKRDLNKTKTITIFKTGAIE